jgi:hypothetical protein
MMSRSSIGGKQCPRSFASRFLAVLGAGEGEKEILKDAQESMDVIEAAAAFSGPERKTAS